MMHRIETTLKAMTIVIAVTGALLWVWPVSVPDTRALPPVVAGAAAQSSTDGSPIDSPAVADIIASNVFSATRAAPRSRYTLPGADGGPEAEPAGAQPDQSATLLVAPPLVFGTMTGPGGATALMQADSAGASGRLYREGERVGAYRVVKISGSSVIVSGPGGRVELRIQPREDRTQ